MTAEGLQAPYADTVQDGFHTPPSAFIAHTGPGRGRAGPGRLEDTPGANEGAAGANAGRRIGYRRVSNA